MVHGSTVRKTPALTRLEKAELFVYYRYFDPPAQLSHSLIRKVLADELMQLKVKPPESRIDEFGKETHRQVFGIAEKAYLDALLNMKKKIFEGDFIPMMSGKTAVALRGKFRGEQLEFSFYETMKTDGKDVPDLLSQKECMRALVFNVFMKQGTGSTEQIGPILEEYVDVQSSYYQISLPKGKIGSMQDACESSVKEFSWDVLDRWALSALSKQFRSFYGVFAGMGGYFGDGYQHLEKQFMENAGKRFLSEADGMLDGLVIKIVDGMKQAMALPAPAAKFPEREQ
ncbi:MAG: hypothetical protein WCY41_03115 [Candidatus Micrarchaeia archaeon]